jgi:hypothetical protein
MWKQMKEEEQNMLTTCNFYTERDPVGCLIW